MSHPGQPDPRRPARPSQPPAPRTPPQPPQAPPHARPQTPPDGYPGWSQPPEHPVAPQAVPPQSPAAHQPPAGPQSPAAHHPSLGSQPYPTTYPGASVPAPFDRVPYGQDPFHDGTFDPFAGTAPAAPGQRRPDPIRPGWFSRILFWLALGLEIVPGLVFTFDLILRELNPIRAGGLNVYDLTVLICLPVGIALVVVALCLVKSSDPGHRIAAIALAVLGIVVRGVSIPIYNALAGADAVLLVAGLLTGTTVALLLVAWNLVHGRRPILILPAIGGGLVTGLAMAFALWIMYSFAGESRIVEWATEPTGGLVYLVVLAAALLVMHLFAARCTRRDT